MGRDYNRQEWEDILKSIDSKNNYLVQEFIEQPELKMGVYEDSKLKLESVNYILGFFLYNQKISGLYARGGRKNIIAPAGESKTIPCFVVDKK